MRNYQNTCYFNAVLQSLLALDKLRARMLGPNAPTGKLGQELQKLFKKTNNTNGAGGVLMPEKLFLDICARNSDFRPGVMEDSNNMLASLIDGLKNEEGTIVELLFRSEFAKHISSKECEHTSVTTGCEYLDLSLTVPPKRLASIEDCLDFHATGEIEDWHCMDCSAAVTAACGNATLNQEDSTDYDGQPEQSENETYENEEFSHPADKQTRKPNQNSGKLHVLDRNSNQMEESHKKQQEGEKIYRAAKVQYRITKAAPILTVQLKRFNYVHSDRPDKLDEHVIF